MKQANKIPKFILKYFLQNEKKIDETFLMFRILNERGERKLTAYLIHSLPCLMSAVQIFCGDRMAVVAHLVGVDQLGYEKELGMTPSVMKNDKSWRGMLLKDNEGDWGVAVAAWRGMKKGQPGVPG